MQAAKGRTAPAAPASDRRLSVRLRRRWLTPADTSLVGERMRPRRALQLTGDGRSGRPQLNALLDDALDGLWLSLLACGAPEPDERPRAAPAPSGRVQFHPGLEHAARRRHAAPHLQRYAEALGQGDGLGAFVEALAARQGGADDDGHDGHAGAGVTALAVAPLAGPATAAVADHLAPHPLSSRWGCGDRSVNGGGGPNLVSATFVERQEDPRGPRRGDA